MSLISILKKKSNNILFTTPSHSQSLFLFSKFKQFYKYDISETDTHNPQEALELAQKKASKIYGTKSTYFLTNGSSSGIIAATLASVKSGEKVLIWNEAHPAHENAVKLAGAIPVYYELKKNTDWDIYLAAEAKEIEKILSQEKIKAVMITSPTYEGMVSDVVKIKEICKKYGAYLIVDEAHGALYPFCDELPASAISQGADFVIQSLHKTAGGLNPTALLHCNLDIDIEPALNMISTTSPSYPLLASIEKNINFLNSKKGRAKILELLKNIARLKINVAQNNNKYEFYKNDDPTKMLIKSANLNGSELSEFLYNKGIEDEKTNTKSTMLLCGIGTDSKRLKKLEHKLRF